MSTQVQQIEESIKAAREYVAVADALGRLSANRDFKVVVLDGYLKNEAVRLVHLKAHPAMQTATSQASITTQIDGIGALLGYFRTIDHQASVSEKSIEADQAALEEVLAEGGDA